MSIQKDNHIDPELKARWGFGGTEGNITVGPETVGETGGVDHARSRIEPGGGRNSGGGGEPSVEAIQLEAVNALAAGLEQGVLNPVEGDGPALRVHQALLGLQENLESLAQSRDDALDKADSLQKQVDDLLQQAQNANEEDVEVKQVAELKSKLDAAGVSYRANASKESLQKLLDEHNKPQE